MSVHIGSFCVAWLDCDYKTASEQLAEARRLAVMVGGTPSPTILEVNQAHLDLVTGNFPSAKAAFERLLGEMRSAVQLAAYDGLARLYFALNDRPACERLVLQGSESQPPSFDYYPLRWSRACAIALNIRSGRLSEAISASEHEIRQALELGDSPLAAHVLVLQAGAYAAKRDGAAGARKLARAVEIGMGHGDQLGHYYAAAGKVLSTVGAPHASTLSSRAARLWRRERNILAQLSALDLPSTLPVRKFTQTDVDHLGAEASFPAADNAVSNRDTAFAVLSSVVAAFELAHDPELTAAELSSIAAEIGCSEQTSFESSSSQGKTQRDGLIGVATLGCGRRGDLIVRCQASDDPALTLGASNLLTLVRRVNDFARFRIDERTRAALWSPEEVPDSDGLFLSDEMLSLAATARKVAPTTVPVLITGETGTGKEILARAIHAASHRAKAIFLPFNCSAGPRDMIDAQLFGHRRGAFTGATEHAPGIIRAAAGGTLFLDEIGESPLEVQPKLLRFLESGEIHPVGEPLPVRADARVIAATNVDLDAAVSSGRFREDLFYRLNIVRLHLPPLRERRVEIPAFAHHYLRKHAHELGKGDLRIAEETMEYLLLFKWPGNVRQLANEMRRLAALAETDAVLMPEHLSSDIVAARRTVPASERPLDPNEVVVRIDQPLAAATEHLERAMLPYAMKQCGGRVEEAAKMLGLSRKGLYLKRVRLGLEPPESHARTA